MFDNLTYDISQNRNNEPQQVLKQVYSILLLALTEGTPVHEVALTKI